METKIANPEMDDLDVKLTERLKQWVDNDPMKMVTFCLCQLGKAVVDSNAAEMTITTEATLSGKRVEVSAVITTKKVKKKK